MDGGGTLDNIGIADSDETEPVEDPHQIPIEQDPSMTVEKTSATTSLSAPQTVTYDYLVTNTGNVTLTGISLADTNDNDDASCLATTLAPAASTRSRRRSWTRTGHRRRTAGCCTTS
jgi:uncharacterized repeat protein (TIGR01451 family)